MPDCKKCGNHLRYIYGTDTFRCDNCGERHFNVVVTEKQREAIELREKAANIRAVAERADRLEYYEREMDEARRLSRRVDWLEPSRPERLRGVQLCILCHNTGYNWKAAPGLRYPMVLCPDCEDASSEDLAIAGRRLLFAARRMEKNNR